MHHHSFTRVIAAEPSIVIELVLLDLLQPNPLVYYNRSLFRSESILLPSLATFTMPRLQADDALTLFQISPRQYHRYGRMNLTQALSRHFEVAKADQWKYPISCLPAQSMYFWTIPNIYSYVIFSLASNFWTGSDCIFSKPIIDETTTILPFGERIGRNCLIKLIVAVTLINRVRLATSTEGITVPKSHPTDAFATITLNTTCLF